MSRQNPPIPAESSVLLARSHTHLLQPSRYPREASRVENFQHAAYHQGQTNRYQPIPFLATGTVEKTRQYSLTTHHSHRDTQAAKYQPLQSVRPKPSFSKASTSDGFITEKERRKLIYKPPSTKNQNQPDPGLPNGYIKENGREIPIWYNPHGIVDKNMAPAAQAEYDRVRREIINGYR